MQSYLLQSSLISLLDFNCSVMYIIKSLKTEEQEQNCDVATQCGCKIHNATFILTIKYTLSQQSIFFIQNVLR